MARNLDDLKQQDNSPARVWEAALDAFPNDEMRIAKSTRREGEAVSTAPVAA